MQKIQFVFRMCVAIAIAASLSVGASADDKLTIGSTAPDLDIEYWLSDNDGLYEHVEKFQEGNVYVISFWATNNGPSRREMTRVAQLQKKFDEKVQFICVSSQELESIQDFLDMPVRGKPDQTYGDATSSFCLVADPDGSVEKDYQKASGVRVLPSAFIVGKSGLIEWFGPLALVNATEGNEPLDQVVNDKWDRDDHKEKVEKARQEIEDSLKTRKRIGEILPPVAEKMQADDVEGALDEIDGLIQAEEGDVKDILYTFKMQILIGKNHERLADGLKDFIAYKKKYDKAGEVNDVVWTIYERHIAQGDIDEEVLKVGLAGAKVAAEAMPENGAILDTYAHMIYVVEKDLDKAIEYQKKAVKFAEGREADLQPFLDDLLEEKKTGKKPTKKKKKDKPKVEESDF